MKQYYDKTLLVSRLRINYFLNAINYFNEKKKGTVMLH